MSDPPTVSRVITSVPEKFDGEGDFSIWLRHFEVCATANCWSAEQRLVFLPTFLKDRAFLAYDDLPATSRSTYERLCNGLVEKFLPPERKRVFMAEFCSRSQRSNERAEDFAAELSRLLARGMPQLSESVRDTFVCEQFLLGLNERLKERVIQADPDTLTSAVSVAKRCEAFLELRSREERKQVSAVSFSAAGNGSDIAERPSPPPNAQLAVQVEELSRQIGKLSSIISNSRSISNQFGGTSDVYNG